MSLPTTLLAYQDCTELLDKALEDDFGVRIKVPNYDRALHERSRIHQARKLHREKNSEVYEPGDPLYGNCIYDCVVVRIKNIEGEFYLYLERNDKVRGEIEPLSALETAEGGEIETTPEVETEKALGIVRRV